jgi:hypothetical protein
MKLSVLTVLLGAMLIASAPAAVAAPPSGSVSEAVGGTCSIVTEAGETVDGTLTGVLTLTRFRASGGQLNVTGTLVGACSGVNAAGETVSQLINTTVTGAVTATGTCQILNLVIGPIHLDLLGLVVDTNQIEIDITAESGPGNLLGNLLCAVANLLNSSGSNTALANLLNQILAILG